MTTRRMTARGMGTEMTVTDPLVNLSDEHQIAGNIDTVAATNPLVSLPVEIFSNILEYLGWRDVVRLDTAFLNRDTRNSYFFALQLRKVKVEDNEFWMKAIDRGILSWLKRRNIRVVSWDLRVKKRLEEIQRLTSATEKLIMMFDDPWEVTHSLTHTHSLTLTHSLT